MLYGPDCEVLVDPAGGPGFSAVEELGRTLRLHRLARGLSLRQMAGRVGLSAHSGLVDYEHGRRVLPEDLALACERALELPPDLLAALRRRALAELAVQKLGQRKPASPNGASPLGRVHSGHHAVAPAPAPPPAAPPECPGSVAAVAARLREIVGIVCAAQAQVLLAVARRIWGEVDSAVPPRP